MNRVLAVGMLLEACVGQYLYAEAVERTGGDIYRIEIGS